MFMLVVVMDKAGQLSWEIQRIFVLRSDYFRFK